MGNPNNWPIVTDAEGYFRSNEKRLLHEQRRPIVGHGNIVGPGIAPNASEVDDWNDDVATTNGYFWSTTATPNAPIASVEFPYDEGDNFWVGHVVSRGDQGYQSLRLLNDGTTPFTEVLDFPYPEVVAIRQWRTPNGERLWGPWAATPLHPSSLSDFAVTALTSSTTLYGGIPVFSPGTVGTLDVSISVTFENTIDTAASYRELNFWPTFDNTAGPPALGAFGKWSHYGRGTVGFHEQVTVSRSWLLEMPSSGGEKILTVAVKAIGANIDIDQIDLYVTQAR